MLKVILDTLEGVENSYHNLYTEKDGKFHLTGVEGIKTQADIDRIQSGLVKERNDHKQTKEKYHFLADRDLTEVQTMLDRYPELETLASGKGDQEAINKLVEARLNTTTAPMKRELDKMIKSNAEKDKLLEQYAQKERTRSIHDSVREAVSKQEGFQPSAVEDALVFAERMLEVTEDGRVVTKDGVGVTPGVDAAVWLLDMQQKKAHWWGPTSGGGSAGSRKGMDTSTNPWSAESWNMTEQSRLYLQNKPRAEQLAKAAGTTIGGMKPQPRK